MSLKARSGFSLIELLVVIAIIAILVALLFPVFSRARESARQSTCMSNMHDIFVKLNLYKQDEGVYPPMLMGYAEQVDGSPMDPTSSPNAVLPTQLKHGFLFPRYINRLETFHCPDNPKNDPTLITQAGYPTSSPWNGVLSGGAATIGSIGIKGLPPAIANQPVGFYMYDSYDATSYMSAAGQTNGNFLVAYTKDWSANGPLNIPGQQDAPYQLKYPQAPPDKTVVTICNRHVTSAGADLCPVLLLSGTTKARQYRDVFQKGWTIGN